MTENKIALNELLKMEMDKIMLKDDLLNFLSRYANKYPQFQSEASIYELKESLIFLKDFNTEGNTYVDYSAKFTINKYIQDLETIAKKKERKQTRDERLLKKIEKAINALYDIKEDFFMGEDIDEEDQKAMYPDEIKMRKNIDDLIYGLYSKIDFYKKDENITPTIANKKFDKSFFELLNERKKNNNISPLELAKAITQLRVTIRNIFNNKPNIRIKSDREA
ncbi:hypothetical protein G6W42_09540 [Campylobacter concisus]|uniref:hypothetical protein n=1 Tax=Campylobacter concisus TaxID=199 RepID=UPI001883AA23|nr:hypothetical protein [Campylobacter concisus]MBE9852849.1 hypothetical protein [Campylobacter concisus]